MCTLCKLCQGEWHEESTDRRMSEEILHERGSLA